MPFVPYVLKAADRRDRLIYVLSQINAARGDGTAELEESSSEEEEAEAEVRLRYFYEVPPGISHSHFRNFTREELKICSKQGGR